MIEIFLIVHCTDNHCSKYDNNCFLLLIVLDEKLIPFEQEKQVTIKFKTQFLTKKYRVDLMCYDSIIVELKAHSDITRQDTAQLINYLKATNCKVGLLINFGAQSLQYKRLVY